MIHWDQRMFSINFEQTVAILFRYNKLNEKNKHPYYYNTIIRKTDIILPF